VHTRNIPEKINKSQKFHFLGVSDSRKSFPVFQFQVKSQKKINLKELNHGGWRIRYVLHSTTCSFALSSKKSIRPFLPKKFKKVSVLDLVPVLRVQKQPEKTFQKTAKMYLVPATNLKNKEKF